MIKVNFSGTDWTEVRRQEKIEMGFNKTTLQIKTSSPVGSQHKISIRFFNSEESNAQAGGVIVVFGETLKYRILNCHSSNGFRYFADEELGGDEKVWTVHRAARQVKLECNGILVFDKEMSETECESGEWEMWERAVDRISFLDIDTASLQYRQWISAGT